MGRGGAKAPGIGIDLGTTYSCVAICRHGNVEIVVNGQGERTTPSWVAFTAKEQLVGDAAKNQVGKNPTNTVYDVKRLIGRNFSDGAVQEDIKLWPFKVDKGKDDKPTIVVQYKGREARFTPEQISSMVLAHMKHIAEACVGNPVTDAVITVPAYFNNAQREATKEAGTSAGLNVLRIINEPTAAAIAYSFNEKNKKNIGKRNVLVFDLGGGTFDVSLMSMDGEDLKVIATTGDTHLGGTDFDGRLVKHCMREIKRRSGVDVLDEPASLRKLRTTCVRAKEILSFQVETTIDIDNLYESFDYQTTISRAKFESLNVDLFNKCIDLVNNCLKDAEMDKSKVDEVLLVGGSTRIPRVRELLKEFFNESKISTGINADEAVASGAAINAAMLGGEESMKFQDVVLQEVTPLPLGIGIVGGVMSIVIPKNTPIPVTKEKLFTTSFDNQTIIDFTVYEGEKICAQENHLIGEFKLSGIPEAPRLYPQIPVQFEINASGILTISAEDRKTRGRQSRIVINKDARGGHENASTNVDTRTGLANYVSELRTRMEDLRATRILRDEDVRNMLNAIENALAVTRDNAVVADDELERRTTELEVTWSALAIQAQSKDVVPRQTEKEGGFWKSLTCCVSGSS